MVKTDPSLSHDLFISQHTWSKNVMVEWACNIADEYIQ